MSDIYLDNNATTPVDPRVLEAMLPYFREEFGNPSSRSHRFGWLAEEAVELARKRVARIINASCRDIFWTSGATEANNTVIQGVARRAGETRRHIITSPIEHKSVVEPCRYLATQGFEVTWLQPDRTGRIAPEQVEDAVRDDTLLVSLMLGHNELGTINPIAEIGEICRRREIVLHTDAAQAYGKIPIDVERMAVGFLTLSAHKIYGPKGVGALYIRRSSPRVELQPLLMGGDQERGIRCGTLNVTGIVGCGAAAELAGRQMAAEAERLSAMRDRLWCGLSERLDDILLNGNTEHRLPHTLNLAFLYVEGESLMVHLGDIAISSGSACTSASLEPSYVLRGIGLDDEAARGSIRFSLGRFNTDKEIDRTIDRVVETVTQLRRMNPRYELATRRKAAR
jgi:cysteine desulfurase